MRLHLFLFPLFLLSLFLQFSPSTWAEDVGPLADPTEWTFNGATTFSPTDIREALLSDVPVLALLRPGAERGELLLTIEQRVALGYACAGFASCQVHARRTGERLVLSITEGARDFCGGIVVVGAREVAAADLQAALGTGWTSSDGTKVLAAWTAGKPVNHDLNALLSWAAYAQRFYRERHHPRAEIVADLVAGATGLDLRLTIRSEGPAVRIGEVTILGCKRFSEASVRALIPLKANNLLPENAPAAICAALRASGRFRAQQAVVIPGTDETLADLKVTVTEGFGTPSPEIALSPVETAALRAAQWLSDHGNHGPEQLLLTASAPTFKLRVIIAGGTGCLVSTTLPGINGPAGGTLLINGSTDQVLVTEHSAGRLPLPPLAWTFDLGIEGQSEISPVAAGERPKETSLRFSLSPSTNRTNKPPLQMNISIEPFVALALVSKAGTEKSITDGILTVQDGPGFRFTADSDTGRLRALEISSHNEAGDNFLLRLTLAESTTLTTAATELNSEPLRKANDHPWSTAVQLLIAETCSVALHMAPVASPDRDWTVIGLGLSPWACEQFLAPLERRLLRVSPDSKSAEETFFIPALIQPRQDQMSQMIGEGCKVASRTLAEIYPANSWPVSLPRSLFLLLRGQSTAGIDDLGDMAGAESTGPLGCLGAATVLAYIHHSGATVFAEQGLSQLDDAGFAKEMVLLTPLAAEIARALDALPIKPDWLTDLTPARQVLVSGFLQAAHVPGTPEVRMRVMAELMWRGWLREWTETRLKAITQPEPP